MRKNTKNMREIKRRFKRIRELMSKVKSPYQGMSKQEIINQIRKNREKLWGEKFVARS